jgi:hypothetical protein
MLKETAVVYVMPLSRNLSGRIDEKHGKKSVLLQSKPTFKPGTSQIRVIIIMS